MRVYTYFCEPCAYQFEIECRMSEYDAKPKCPMCNQKSGVYRHYQSDSVIVNDGNPRTVGMLAEKNSRLKGIDV